MKCLIRLILAVVLFSMGWMVGLYVEHWDVFHLTFDVPAFNIINLLVISFLAWGVNYSIQNSARKVKSRIDLVSSKIDEVDASLKRINDLCSSVNGASYVEICSIDKHNRAWIAKISEVIEKHYSDVCDKSVYDSIDANLKEIRKLVTNSVIQTEGGDSDIIITSGIVKYSPNRKAEIDVIVEASRYILYQMKVCISQK